jgi:hypothetical protein
MKIIFKTKTKKKTMKKNFPISLFDFCSSPSPSSSSSVTNRLLGKFVQTSKKWRKIKYV